MRIRLSILYAVALSLVCGTVSAQQKVNADGVASIAMQFACQPRTAASLAMAGIGVFDDAAFFVRDTGRVELDLSYAMWERTSAVSTGDVDAGVKYRANSFLGVTVDMHIGKMKNTIPTDESGDFLRNGRYSPSNLSLGLGADFRVIRNVDVKLKARYLRSNFYLGQDYWAVAGDAVATGYFGPVGVAAGVANIGPKVSGKYSLPSYALLGATYGYKGIEARLEGDYYFFGAFRLAAAASYTFKNIATVRLGYNMGNGTPLENYASAGLGVRLFGIQLNLTYLFSDNPLNGTAGIGLNYKF